MRHLLLVTLLACGSKDAPPKPAEANHAPAVEVSHAPAEQARPPAPIEVKVDKLEKADVVGDYMKRTAAAGKTWVCLQLAVTNRDLDDTGGLPMWIFDGKGARDGNDAMASGSYNATVAEKSVKVGRGKTGRQNACFEVDKASTSGMKLVLESGWKITIDLPSA